jgi:hypothetical protein
MVQLIVSKAGLPKEKNSSIGYLSRRQMQALLLWIDKNERDWKEVNETLGQLNESKINAGNQPEECESQSI